MIDVYIRLVEDGDYHGVRIAQLVDEHWRV